MLKVSDIKNLYEKHNVQASKRFGQNFLIDQNILSKIQNIFDLKDKNVVEIGPGLGFLTLYLLEKAKTVTSYEIDQDMIRVLKEEINDNKFTLIEGDFLKQDLNFKTKKILVANIPYNITSDILFKLFENSSMFNGAVLMMQKEVAQRLTAKVNSKNYGKLTLTTQHFVEVNYEFDVPPNSFIPAPKVTSTVVSFKFKDIDFKKSKEFIKFIKMCFLMRRKTLLNNLKKFLDASKAKKIIKNLNFKDSIRPQELTYFDFVNLFNCL